MDVVLLKEVERLGPEGAVVHVKPGFARNYLIPRGLAAPATPAQLKILATLTQQRRRTLQRAKDEAETLKRSLESRPLTLSLNVGEDGKSFGSVTAHDIVASLAQSGVSIDKHEIRLAEPIKTLGVFEIPIRVHPEVTATVKLSVVKS